MAVQNQPTIIDTSGYTPSRDAIRELQKMLRHSHEISLPRASWVSQRCQVPNSQDASLNKGRHILHLSLTDLREIEEAFESFKVTNLPLNKLQAKHFPLPTLSSRIRERCKLLPNKQPYFIIRGLRPQWFSKYKNVVIHAGIASHVGTKRAIAAGDTNVLHHVTNIEMPCEKEQCVYRGPANRTLALPFHTDYGAIVSLYVLSRPASGGDFYLADIHDIVSEISKPRSDIIETLRQPFTMVNASADGCYDSRPLLLPLPSGDLAIQASRSRLFGTSSRPRSPPLPQLTTNQMEAIDALHAAGQLVAHRFEFQSGDMMFFNNLRMMHARDAFVDGNEEENTTKRYLLRLILEDDSDDVTWEIPSELEGLWQELYDHEDDEEIFTVHPELFSFKASH